MEIYAIADGVVLPYILDPNFEKYLPIIPAEVVKVNFTWKAGDQKVSCNMLYFLQVRKVHTGLISSSG